MAYATAKNILAITLETSSVYEYARFQIHSQLKEHHVTQWICLLYTSPSPRDPKTSRMPSSA